MNSDAAQLEQLAGVRAAAIRAKDAGAVRATFASGAVGYFVETPLAQSPLKEDLPGWFATWSGAIGYEAGLI